MAARGLGCSTHGAHLHWDAISSVLLRTPPDPSRPRSVPMLRACRAPMPLSCSDHTLLGLTSHLTHNHSDLI